MRRVIIVEDDAIVRTYLRNLIEWESLGFTILGEMENGLEAKKFVEANQVDIVITDISMPVMNGIDLIKNINEISKLTKIIVLSCYSDYDFIREALKCGVCDYILKQHLKAESLIELLKKIDKSLDDEQGDIKNSSKGVHIDKSNILNNLINGVTLTSEDFKGQYYEYDYLFNASRYYIFVLKIDDYESIKETVSFQEIKKYNSDIALFIEKCLKGENLNGISGITRNNEIIALFGLSTSEDIKEIRIKAHTVFNQIRNYIKENLTYTYSATVSYYFSDMVEISQVYKIAKSALESYMLFSKDNIFFIESDKVQYSIMLTLEDQKSLLNAVIEGNEIQAEYLVNSYIETLKKSAHKFEISKMYLLDILNFILKIAVKFEIDTFTLFNCNYIPYEKIESMRNIYELKDWFVDIVKKLINQSNDRNFIHRRDIMKAIEYIENHYTEDLSLTDVSKYVMISPNYFSMIFKKEVGESFSEYILKLKLEKSKLLLKNDDKKVYEAAEESGFRNNQYFNRVFKEYYGMTPLEFKKSVV